MWSGLRVGDGLVHLCVMTKDAVDAGELQRESRFVMLTGDAGGNTTGRRVDQPVNGESTAGTDGFTPMTHAPSGRAAN